MSTRRKPRLLCSRLVPARLILSSHSCRLPLRTIPNRWVELPAATRCFDYLLSRNLYLLYSVLERWIASSGSEWYYIIAPRVGLWNGRRPSAPFIDKSWPRGWYIKPIPYCIPFSLLVICLSVDRWLVYVALWSSFVCCFFFSFQIRWASRTNRFFP